MGRRSLEKRGVPNSPGGIDTSIQADRLRRWRALNTYVRPKPHHLKALTKKKHDFHLLLFEGVGATDFKAAPRDQVIVVATSAEAEASQKEALEAFLSKEGEDPEGEHPHHSAHC
ncbi:hypothetical protein GW17_00008653 [Ensete ventricosum]|nr:hypothetical protein GW17_00008653 [Ensete ventricosum]